MSDKQPRSQSFDPQSLISQFLSVESDLADRYRELCQLRAELERLAAQSKMNERLKSQTRKPARGFCRDELLGGVPHRDIDADFSEPLPRQNTARLI